MEKILTIVIPTYNMEKFLRHCLDSLIVSTEHMQMLEILVVIDGGKDNSSKIAHEYQDKFPDTFRVIDKENGNYGSCVNRGLKEAKGKYIKILDADDSFNTKNFNAFIERLKDLEVDMIMSDYNFVNEEGTITGSVSYNLPLEQIFTIDTIDSAIPKINLQMHAVTYRTENLRNINYKQTEGISYTDQQWIFLPILVCQKIYYINLNLYQYLLGREGQTMSSSVLAKSMGHKIKCALDMLDSYTKLEHIETKEFHHVKEHLMMTIKHIYTYYILDVREFSNASLIDFDKKIKTLNQNIYDDLNVVSFRTMFSTFYIQQWRNRAYSSLSTIDSVNYQFYRLIRKLKKTMFL